MGTRRTSRHHASAGRSRRDPAHHGKEHRTARGRGRAMSLARDIIAAARLRVWRKHPYYMHILFKLRPVERMGINGASVDAGLRLWYDPETIEREFGAEYAPTLLVHELMHVLARHGEREADARMMLEGRFAPVAATIGDRLGLRI